MKEDNNLEVKQSLNKDVEVPPFCKNMNKVMVSLMIFMIISVFFIMTDTNASWGLSLLGIAYGVIVFSIDIFAIVEQLFLLIGKTKDEKSSILFYILFDIVIAVVIGIYFVLCYISTRNLPGLL